MILKYARGLVARPPLCYTVKWEETKIPFFARERISSSVWNPCRARVAAGSSVSAVHSGPTGETYREEDSARAQCCRRHSGGVRIARRTRRTTHTRVRRGDRR